MDLKKELTDIARKAQDASRQMLSVSTATKNKILKSMAAALINKKDYILKANKKEIAKCKSKNLFLVLF